jgi:16S rRNA (guanine966-N2)-methyltransferase
VTGGALRGRRLRTPRGRGVRPSSDRVREALFQILAGRLAGARVVDAFAGTGALGIEALSRGAAHCVFVEQRSEVAALLGRNLEALALGPRALVRNERVEHWLVARSAHDAAGCDLVLLDPPYARCDLGPVIDGCLALLAPGGLLVWEHRRGAAMPDCAARRVDARAYGDTGLSFLESAAGRPAPDD